MCRRATAKADYRPSNQKSGKKTEIQYRKLIVASESRNTLKKAKRANPNCVRPRKPDRLILMQKIAGKAQTPIRLPTPGNERRNERTNQNHCNSVWRFFPNSQSPSQTRFQMIISAALPVSQDSTRSPRKFVAQLRELGLTHMSFRSTTTSP